MACDWRWQNDRADSPWYPSIRLFRQEQRGDWTGVFGRIAAELRQRAGAPVREPGEPRSILAPVSAGDLLDRISILRLKAARINDAEKLFHVSAELAALQEVRAAALADAGAYGPLEAELAEVNRALWEVEDALRQCEARGDFGAGFVDLARSVYRHNDRRCRIKRDINLRSGSLLIEEKAYGCGGDSTARFTAVFRNSVEIPAED